MKRSESSDPSIVTQVKASRPVRRGRAPSSPSAVGECWIDTFEGKTFQGTMHRFRGPADISVSASRGIGSLIVGPQAAIIAIGHCGGGSAGDGKMLLQLRPRQIIEDFKKIRGASDIEWLRILELPAGGR
ncbi:MAG TPA: hypothetical protein VMD30_08640 [Tepidisphaeraceae bacterium]|nr:hypothetical protein [Tepidisphaeraceae bacterium]